MRSLVEMVLFAILGFAVVAAPGWIQPVVVAGGSMEPSVMKGDVCIAVRHLPIRDGDVVLFVTPQKKLVLHRAVSLTGEGELITRGDANAHEDSLPVAPQRIVGRAVCVIPTGRILAGWLGAGGGATLQNQSNSK